MGDKKRTALRKKARKSINMEKMLSGIVDEVESISSNSFTHKCKCPNPNHKGGEERTPSFYFSDVDSTFKCFGCNWNGDVFDLIALLKGMPVDALVDKYVKEKGIKVLLDEIDNTVKFDILKLKYELSIVLRNHYEAYGDKEADWIDSLSIRVDERFSKLTNADYKEAHSFYMQVLLEVSRRKI